ncbi:hypothetical protein TN53_14885 [Streptomyces sp. WM6386]|nr:hypothetical protein TN53_14885 [Streptomyces sp. WM6386]
MIAALIGVPGALVTALAGYAAGQRQARGAVDAVKRQHQHDTYVRLITEANSWANSMLRVPVATRVDRTHPELSAPTRETELVQTLSSTAIEGAEDRGRFDDALAVVAIEGSIDVLEGAAAVSEALGDITARVFSDARAARAGEMTALEWLSNDQDLTRAYRQAMHRFQLAANVHLNGRP